MLINEIKNPVPLPLLLQFKRQEQKVMKKIQENIRALIQKHQKAQIEEEKYFWYHRCK